MATLAVRNNNPGNLRDVKTGAFRQFATQEEGYAALLNDLDAKRTGATRTGLNGNSSLSQFASVYAPAGDNNNPTQYANNLASKLGSNAPIGQQDIGKLAVAIAQNEDPSAAQHSAGGSPGFISDAQMAQMQGGGTPAPSGGSTGNAPGFISDADFASMGGQQPAPAPTPAPNVPNAVGTPPGQFNSYSLSGRGEEPQNKGVVGFLGSVAKAIAEPVVNMIARPGQLVQHTLGGDTQPIEGKFLGLDITDPYSRGFSEVGKDVGRGIETVSLGLPIKGLGSAAGVGATQGLGSSIASQGLAESFTTPQGLTNTALNTGVGAIAGGATYGATKAIGGAIKGAGDLMSGKTATQAREGIYKAYESALNLNVSERGFENRTGKDLARVLLDNNAPLGRYDNGTLDASDAIKILRDKLAPLNTEASDLLNNPQGVVHNIHFGNVYDQVAKRINESTFTQTQKNAMLREAKQLIAAEVQQHGLEITPAVSDKIKQGFWNTTFNRSVTSRDALTSNTNYLVGNTLKDLEEKAIAGTDAGDVLGGINKQRSDYIDAIKRLSKLDGVKLLKGGRLGNMWGGLIGSIAAGATGGGPGAVLAGDFFGSKAAQFINNPAFKIGAAKARQSVLNGIPISKTAGQGMGVVGAGLKNAAGTAARFGQPAANTFLGQ